MRRYQIESIYRLHAGRSTNFTTFRLRSCIARKSLHLMKSLEIGTIQNGTFRIAAIPFLRNPLAGNSLSSRSKHLPAWRSGIRICYVTRNATNGVVPRAGHPPQILTQLIDAPRPLSGNVSVKRATRFPANCGDSPCSFSRGAVKGRSRAGAALSEVDPQYEFDHPRARVLRVIQVLVSRGHLSEARADRR